MPGGDRTGPFGYGPMTGRRTGYCSGSGTPGYSNTAYGLGRGCGGGGRGWKHMLYAAGQPRWAGGYPARQAWPGYNARGYQGELTPEGEMEALKAQSEFFQKQIDMLNGRIKEMEDIAAGKRDSNA